MALTGSKTTITVLKDYKPVLKFSPRHEGGTIYVIKSKIQEAHTIATSIFGINFDIMHRRLAHPSKEVLLKSRKYLKDFPEIEFPKEELICPGCAQGKMTNKPFHENPVRARRPLQLIHSDLKAFPVESYHKYKYSIVFMDDYTSFTWTVNLHTKDAALTATYHFIQMVEKRFEVNILQWKSDAGGEYKSKAFIKMLQDRGIEILQSVPYTHQQNGRVERMIRTIMEKSESMRLHACIPQSWWEFLVEHATHVYNRTLLRCLNWQTPYQLLYGDKPSIGHLKVFGCGAYVFIPAEICKNKLAPKSELMTYLGNAPGMKGFMFMRAPNNVVFYAAHCIFDESLFPKCSSPSKRALTRLLEVPPSHEEHREEIPTMEEDHPPAQERRRKTRMTESKRRSPVWSPPAPSPPWLLSPPSPPVGPRTLTREHAPVQWYGFDDRNVIPGRSNERSDPPPEPSPGRDEDFGLYDFPLPAQSPTQSEQDIEEGNLFVDAAAEQLCWNGGIHLINFLVSKAISPSSGPKEWTYKDVINLPELEYQEWKDACLRELSTLKECDVYDIVPCPKG